MSFSWLQWCAPELARGGFLVNERWVEQHSAEAVGMFGNQGLHTAATIMAAINPYAIDYIRQAPVLVLAGTNGGTLSRKRDREFLARRWSSLLAGGPKLKDVMAHYGLRPQHRQLRPGVLLPSRWETVRALSKLDPSTLAQSVPTDRQGNWLMMLGAWRSTMGRRYGDAEKHLSWAALAFSRNRDRVISAADLADFAGSPAVNFDERWNLDQAAAASTRWHVELQRMTGEQKFYQQNGIGWSDPIDYGRLPIADLRGGFEIVALRSGEDLYTEGVEMHHCVASYTRDVVLGKSRIYSVRSQDGSRRHATFEIVQTTGSKWGLRQIKGPCNRPVVSQIDGAVASFVKQINEAVA
jgi:hypothetical protein